MPPKAHHGNADDRSARAFAAKPSRRAARPYGRWGLTAQRGRAEGLPCLECTNAAFAEPATLTHVRARMSGPSNR
jgi:hypothetical protein